MNTGYMINNYLLPICKVYLAAAVLSASAIAQVAVYSYSSLSTVTGKGYLSKLVENGAWVLDANSDRVFKIVVYPATKSMYKYDTYENSLPVYGPKGSKYFISGYASSWVNDTNNPVQDFLSYNSFFGVCRPTRLGGAYPSVPIPANMSGPDSFVFVDYTNGHKFFNGSQALTLDLKTTQNFNSIGISVDTAAANIISNYQRKGFVLLN